MKLRTYLRALPHLALSAAAWAAVIQPRPAHAQNTIGGRIKSVSEEFGGAGNASLPVVGMILGAVLLCIGAWNFYSISRRNGGERGSMLTAICATFAGCVFLALGTWATLGTNTVTGGGVTMKGTGQMTWQ